MTDNPPTETAAVASDLEGIRHTLAAVATDRPTPEQIAEWNTADKEMAQRVRAALPGVPLHHVYAVLRASRTLQRMDAAAAGPAAPSRADLVEVAAQAIRDSNGTPEALEWWRTHPQLIPAHVYAAAVLAVLPPAADRAAVLLEVADFLRGLRATGTTATVQDIETELREWAAALRRLAAEAPQPEGYEATTGHLITCLAVAGGSPDPDCSCAAKTKHREVSDETRPLCACGRFWPCALADAPAVPVQPAADGWRGATELVPDREVQRLAATGLVGYQQDRGRLLHCLHHKPAPASRYVDFQEVTAEDLPEGGICVHPSCGADLLAVQPVAADNGKEA